MNEADLSKISFQQKCRVSPEAYPDKAYEGYVAEIAPEANRAKGTLQIKVQIRDTRARAAAPNPRPKRTRTSLPRWTTPGRTPLQEVTLNSRGQRQRRGDRSPPSRNSRSSRKDVQLSLRPLPCCHRLFPSPRRPTIHIPTTQRCAICTGNTRFKAARISSGLEPASLRTGQATPIN